MAQQPPSPIQGPVFLLLGTTPEDPGNKLKMEREYPFRERHDYVGEVPGAQRPARRSPSDGCPLHLRPRCNLMGRRATSPQCAPQNGTLPDVSRIARSAPSSSDYFPRHRGEAFLLRRGSPANTLVPAKRRPDDCAAIDSRVRATAALDVPHVKLWRKACATCPEPGRAQDRRSGGVHAHVLLRGRPAV